MPPMLPPMLPPMPLMPLIMPLVPLKPQLVPLPPQLVTLPPQLVTLPLVLGLLPHDKRICMAHHKPEVKIQVVAVVLNAKKCANALADDDDQIIDFIMYIKQIKNRSSTKAPSV